MRNRAKIDDLFSWKVFMAVANFGSMNQAARKLGMDVSSVSRRIDALEANLNCKLFARSLRSCQLTTDGERVIKAIAPVMLKFSSVVEGLMDDETHIQGKISVCCPDCLIEHVIRWMAEFQEQHTDLMIEIGCGDESCSELLGGEYDLVIGMKYSSNGLCQTIDLGPMPSYICATPEYIRTHGTLRSVEDFKDHRVLINSKWMCPSLLYDPATQGALAHESGKRFRCTTMTALKAATLQSIGVAIGLPKACCQKELENGELVRLLEPLEGLSLHFYANILNEERIAPRLSKLCCWLQQKWSEEMGMCGEEPIGRCCTLGNMRSFDF